MLRRKTFLGLSLGEHFLTIAEIAFKGKKIHIQRSASWEYPPGTKFSALLGEQFKNFLHQQGFSARRVTVGAPASWILVREKKTPCADISTLSKLVRLESEKDFTLPVENLCLDFLVASKTDSECRLLVLAISAEKIKQIREFIQAAGLRITAVVPSVSGLNLLAEGNDRFILYLNAEEMVLCLQIAGQFQFLRRVGLSLLTEDRERWLEYLSSHFQRLLLLLPEYWKKRIPQEVIVFDDCGVEKSIWENLGKKLGLNLKPASDCQPFSSAVGSGLLGYYPEKIPINFLSPKNFTPQNKNAVSVKKLSPLLWSVAAVVIILTLGWYFLYQEEKSIQQLRENLQTLEQQTAGTRKIKDQMESLQRWQKNQPHLLDLLREITLCFPPDGGIWATSLAIQANQKGVLTGKAEEEAKVLQLLTRLKSASGLTQVNLLYLRGPGSQNQKLQYAISFTLKPDWILEKRAETVP